MRVNIKGYGQFFTHLNIELLQFIFSKNAEATPPGVLVGGCLNDKILTLPRLVGSCRDSAARFSNYNDFTLYVHFLLK